MLLRNIVTEIIEKKCEICIMYKVYYLVKEIKMQTILLELRAGEGGMDSKLFMKDMADMYSRYCAHINSVMECL